MTERTVRVVVDRPLRSALDYLPPEGRPAESIPAGVRVRVPLGRGSAIGLVIGTADGSAVPEARLRRITALLEEEPLIPADLLGLLAWTADYYHHPIGEVILSALPETLRKGRDASRRRKPRSEVPATATPTPTLTTRAMGMPQLTPAQSHALEAIEASAGTYRAIVLDGATGSGKTEVYLRAVTAALARGATALVLVPEIALTPQLVGRFRERFIEPIAVLHSGVGESRRLAAWRAIAQGAARIVIGTRSAVFAPLRDLGLIVLDEEHDASYKQQEGGCRYSARDVAVWRARRAGVPVVLGSATPSLETLHNVERGRYTRCALPRREDQAAPPRLTLIDLRGATVQAGIAGPVARAIERHLADAGQVLVYINRRGFAPTLLCTGCGWIAPCRACDARLTVHRRAQRLRCHFCGADEPLPERCPRCGFEVRPVGQGTQRVEETLAAMFPKERLVRLDRDAARHAADVEQVVQAVLEGEARILVGTQMVTKGHHFPAVTLVVVLNADQGLFSIDFRAPERLAQTIVQVAGRAGRAERPGEVMIQTLYPDHPLLQGLLAGGYADFAAGALAERRAAHWPPFTYLALLRASARTPADVHDFLTAARAEGEALGAGAVRLLGPVDAAMARRAGRHHAQVLVEADRRGELHGFLEHWLARIEPLPSARRVRWALDVDPLETQ